MSFYFQFGAHNSPFIRIQFNLKHLTDFICYLRAPKCINFLAGMKTILCHFQIQALETLQIIFNPLHIALLLHKFGKIFIHAFGILPK